MADLIDRNALRKIICAACSERLLCADMGNVCYEVACINNAPKIETAPKWIPCSERLPESVGNKVIVFCIGDEPNTNYVGFGHYDNYPHIEEWYNLETGFPFADMGLVVTHWMPLPEMPESEGLEE